MKRRKKGLRAALELALAREGYFGLTTPGALWRQLIASQRGRTWTRLRTSGWMVNEDGTPNRDYVSALETFLAAVETACQSQYQDVFVFMSKKFPAGEQSLKRLRRVGANPVWIVEDCLDLRPHRLLGNRRPPNNPRLRKHVINQLNRLSRQFASLADAHSALRSAAREIGFTGVRQEPIAFLRKESQSLARFAKSMTARGPSSESSKALALAEHLVLTTGTYQDHEVCRLLDAVQPTKNDTDWTTGALEQFRVRQKKTEGGQLFTEIAQMVDDEIERRRELAGVRPIRQPRP
jgi:hypothetical protein